MSIFHFTFLKKAFLRAADPPCTVKRMLSAIKEWALVLQKHNLKAKHKLQVRRNEKVLSSPHPPTRHTHTLSLLEDWKNAL